MVLKNLDDRIHVLNTDNNYLNVVKLIADFPDQKDSFYVLDVNDIIRKHTQFKQLMPRVHPYYAVKCNESLLVLEILAALGIGFDCASKAEISKVLSVGVDPSRIIFANPTKQFAHITHASATGVKLMTFDNEFELKKIKNLFPGAKLLIRIKCDDKTAYRPLGLKFGCDIETEVPNLLHLARALDLDVVGVSFHVGSGCCNPVIYQLAIQATREVFDFAKTLGYSMTTVNLGGGFPGNRGISIEKFADVINETLAEYFPEDSVNIIAEPGRYYVASAYTLACNIHSKRVIRTQDNSSISHIMYYLNEGCYGSFSCIVYNTAEVVLKLLKDDSSRQTYLSTVWGPTCDSLDKIVDNIILPEMDLGEWIYVENMGAYTIPLISLFNGFVTPKVYAFVNKEGATLLKNSLPSIEEHFDHDDKRFIHF